MSFRLLSCQGGGRHVRQDFGETRGKRLRQLSEARLCFKDGEVYDPSRRVAQDQCHAEVPPGLEGKAKGVGGPKAGALLKPFVVGFKQGPGCSYAGHMRARIFLAWALRKLAQKAHIPQMATRRDVDRRNPRDTGLSSQTKVA